MLPKLTSLDTLLVAEETKQLAEATFLKKQMFYNMRIKTACRNARNIIRIAAEGKKVSGRARARGRARGQHACAPPSAPPAHGLSLHTRALPLTCAHRR